MPAGADIREIHDRDYLQMLHGTSSAALKELEDLRTLAEPIVKIAGCRMEGLGSRADGLRKNTERSLK